MGRTVVHVCLVLHKMVLGVAMTLMNVKLTLMNVTMNLFVSTQKDPINASVKMNSLVMAHFVKVCCFNFLRIG